MAGVRGALATYLSPQLKKRVHDLGAGRSEYTRFLIVGRSRVGSNLLRGLLNAHPGTIAFGEVFRDVRSLDWDHIGYFQSAAMRGLVAADPVRFVDTKVFGRYPRSTEAVGFKLFYYHARAAAQSALWPHLQQRRELRVIHLKRRNLLQTHLSRKRAAVTDEWVNTSGAAADGGAVRLDYDECLKDFEQTRAWEEACDRDFAGHPVLQLQYEALAEDHATQMTRVQAFLGVTPVPVEPTTFQQARQKLSDTIVNYVELKRRFNGTVWEDCFTD